jgi:acetolactate synthase-1/2/3 large subunit
MTAPPTAVDVLAAALAERGARHAFGMPGGATLPFVEALRARGVDFVLVRDEASAGFAADATFQLTGAPGVCVATLGPGATNLVSGVAGCLLDRAAAVAVTSQVAADQQQIYTHQTLDIAALFRPITRAGVTLTAGGAAREIALVLRQLHAGRPAPVHVHIPADVSEAPQTALLPDAFCPARSRPNPSTVDSAAGRLGMARRPVIFAGFGARRASPALRSLAERLRAPVLTTYKAKGVVDERGGWSAGAAGLSPVVDAHQQGLLARADLLLAVGLDPVELRPNWLPGWPAELPMIAVDEHPPDDLLHAPEALLVGDVAWTLGRLEARLGELRSEWSLAEVGAHRDLTEAPFNDGPDGPGAAVRALQSGLPDDAVVALDVGAHRITASHAWRCSAPDTLLQSNGFSSMGYGLPAAIAARLALPGRAVACLTGDMGLWMTLGELGVVQERGLDLVVVYLADRALSLIALKQERQGLPPAAVRFENPRVQHLAAAFGGVGLTATPGELGAAAAAAVERGGLTLIEVPIDAAAYRRQM